ncbi:MAG: lipid A deacylase LpxR family protein [Desulfobacteraceae bacterium]
MVLLKNSTQNKGPGFFIILTGITIFFSVFFSVLSAQASARAGDGSQGYHRFSVFLENDAFASDDSQYTSGIKLIWSRYNLSDLPDDAWLHKWLYPLINTLNFYNSPEFKKALTFTLGQKIYTPDDTDSKELIESDRPYAGITFAELGFHKISQKSMHTLEFGAGIVGPESFAEDVQSWTHDILGNNEPEGWDHQLENEPIVCLIYDYKKKLFQKNIMQGYGGDVILNMGGDLSNARTFTKIGFLGRYGWNVPENFGHFPIEPATTFNTQIPEYGPEKNKSRFGLHLFAAARTKWMIRDIFLDGNSFRSSHSVDKKKLVSVFSGGVELTWSRITTALSYVHRTKSFNRQDEPQKFITINLSFNY